MGIGAPQHPEQLFFRGHPSWLAVLHLYAKALLRAVLAGVAAGIVSAAVDGSVQVGWVVVVVLIVLGLGLLRGLIERLRTTYTITSERLMIEQGLLSRELRQTRLDRVQNVCARQTPYERLLGVGTVDFDTAGSANFDFAFYGVADPREIVNTVNRALRESPRYLRM